MQNNYHFMNVLIVLENEGLSPGVFTEEVLHHIVLSSQGDIRYNIITIINSIILIAI